jgi:phosphoenolpyruvate synthase/pyruvate phosphate dikinase
MIHFDPRSHIIWLGDTLSHDPRLVGPKAAHLSWLMSSCRVPPGFCLSADAYRHAAANGGMTPGMRDAVAEAYQSLAEHVGVDQPRVAVRSSAVDEDGPLASFAGQHETLLNISGIEAVLAAIERSWDSARTEQALSYRSQHGLSIEDIGLAVLVQSLVPSDVSGVLFSANPVSGRRDEIVVSASWGLGESIVGGTVTPDNWVADAHSLRIVDERLGDKRRMTVSVSGGTAEVDVPRFMRGQPSLSNEQVQEVARLGLRLAAAKGWPVDIEFAYAGGDLFLLQCRPITTLIPNGHVVPDDSAIVQAQPQAALRA